MNSLSLPASPEVPVSARPLPTMSRRKALAALMMPMLGGSLLASQFPDESTNDLFTYGRLIKSKEEFLTLIRNGKLEKRVVEIQQSGHFAYFTYLPRLPHREETTYVLRGVTLEQREAFLKELKKSGCMLLAGNGNFIPSVSELIARKKEKLSEKYQAAFMSLLFTAPILYLALKQFGLGGKIKLDRLEASSYSFNDVGGMPQVLLELQKVKKTIDAYKDGHSTVRLPNGILFHGEPGTGKTHLARCLAGEIGCPVFYVSSSDLQSSPFVGQWATSIKTLFRQGRRERDARRAKYARLASVFKKNVAGSERPVIIIVLDEIETIGGKRIDADINGSVSREHSKAVNTLLQELDGIDQGLNAGIILIGATNAQEKMDPALLRPGRFPVKISIPTPQTQAQRLDILRKLSERLCQDSFDVSQKDELLSFVASLTPRSTGDDLRDILDQSKAAIEGTGGKIDRATLFKSLMNQQFGIPTTMALTREKVELIHSHEHGHGLVATAIGIDVLGVSFVPRGNHAAAVLINTEELLSPPVLLSSLLKSLVACMAGRAAEIVRYGEAGISDGAQMDIHQAREIAKRVITCGMLPGENHFREVPAQGHISDEKYLAKIDTLIAQGLSVATKILNQLGGKPVIEELAERGQKLTNTEMLGLEAQQFYSLAVLEEHKPSVDQLLQTFIQNPLGSAHAITK